MSKHSIVRNFRERRSQIVARIFCKLVVRILDRNIAIEIHVIAYLRSSRTSRVFVGIPHWNVIVIYIRE